MDNVEVNGLRVAYRRAGRGPALVLYGDADRRSPPEAVAAELHRDPGVEAGGPARVGHAANMEAPDRFNAEVREFLRSVP
jgi:pimeloyl-ACP methyl ester carboxylesterase